MKEPIDGQLLEQWKQSNDALMKMLEKQLARLDRLAASTARHEWRHLLSTIADQQRLEHWGFKAYSQNDEDGIVAEIFRRVGIGPASGIFVEFGVSNGLENNTHYLLRQGYRGAWLEASGGKVEKIERLFGDFLKTGHLRLSRSLVTAENVDAEVAALAGNDTVTLLSIDVDGNDYWLWKALTRVDPAVVLIEYNGKFPPPVAMVQRYRPDHRWTGTDYFGASLSALVKLGCAKGYSLVACNITGSNAFFVRRDLVGDRFPYELTAETLYHPCRYDLARDCFGRVGHEPDVGTYVLV